MDAGLVKGEGFAGLNYLIDIKHAVIIDIGATPARTYDKVAATRTRIDWTEKTSGVKPEFRAADTAPGLQKLQYVSFTPLIVDFFNGSTLRWPSSPKQNATNRQIGKNGNRSIQLSGMNNPGARHD